VARREYRKGVNRSMTKKVEVDFRSTGRKSAGLWKRTLGVALAAVMLVSGAACNVADSRANTVLAEVGDVKIYRWELDKLYDENREMFESNSGVADMDLDSSKFSEQRLQFRRDLLQTLIDDVIATESAKADGYDLNGEEQAQLEKDYEEWKKANIETIEKQKYSKDKDGYVKAEEEWLKKLSDNHLTEETLKESRYNDTVREKLSADLFAGIQVDDDELRRAYDQKIADEKEKYKENPEAYEKQYAKDAFTPNSPTIVYHPPGFVRVVQIFIALPEDVDNELKELSRKQYEMMLQQSDLAAEKGKEDPQVKEMQKDLKSMADQETELYAKGYEAIQDRVDEVYAKVQAGEDFHALIEEYGEDPGMVYPFDEYGYLVGAQSEQLVAGLREAALSVKKVGDVSEPKKSIMGYHIVKLVSKVEEGPVSFEDSKEFFKELATGEPMINTLDEYVQKNREKFDVKVYDESL
jgi:PPIC-type PPIASE domain.